MLHVSSLLSLPSPSPDAVTSRLSSYPFLSLFLSPSPITSYTGSASAGS